MAIGLRDGGGGVCPAGKAPLFFAAGTLLGALLGLAFGVGSLLWGRTRKRGQGRLAQPLLAEENSTLLAAAIEQTSEGVLITDRDGVIRYVNAAFTRMTGYSAAEAIGQNPRIVKSGKQTPGFYRDLWGAISAGRAWQGHLTNRRKDGTLYEEDLTITPVRGAGGAIAHFIAIKKDVTERLRQEQAIQQSEEKYRQLVANIPDVVWTADPQGRCVFVTPNIEVIYGYTPEEIYTSGVWYDRIDPEDVQKVQTAFEAFLRSGELFSVEYRVRRKDGALIWLHARALHSYLEGEKRYIVGVCSEVTQRKRMEQALVESERKYRTLITSIPDCTWVADAEGRVVFVSPNIERMLGQPAEEFYRRGAEAWFELLHPEDAPRARDAFRALFDQHEPYDVECRLRTGQGGWMWVHDRAMVTQGPDGKWYAHGLVSDITERKRAEEARRKADERYRRLFERNMAGVLQSALDGRLLDCNGAIAQILGYGSREELLSGDLTAWDMYFEAEGRREFVAALTSRGTVTNRELKLRRKDGTAAWVLANASLVEGDNGENPVLEGTVVDISARKLAEEAWKKAKEAAEGANRAKSEFLANMSHEIRTPLNGVLGMTDLALDTELTSEQREYLEIARTSGEALLGVINDILDFSKIEARRLDLERIPFNLRETVASAIKPLGMRAAEKNLELMYEVAPDVPQTVEGDPGRLRQVLVNLVGNALKFTERGEVMVQVETTSCARGSVALAFSVRDTGSGIPPEKQQTIFDAFSQADNTVTRRFGGSGLGLTICSQLVSMMGGKLSVESDPGKGSTFRFTVSLGLAQGQPEEPVRAAIASLSDLPVLAVDDNATNGRLLHEQLTAWGMRPTISSSGREALERLKRATQDGAPYALILVDARMPEMDGFAFVERIKQDPQLAAIPAIMLTSGRRHGDAERCHQIGMAAYLTKPAGEPELLEAILRVLGRGASGAAKPQLITRDVLRETRRVWQALVVDDNPVNRRLATRLLEKHGHVAQTATTGQGALEALANKKFDVILMDVQMPDMDGFEATAAIREGERANGTHTPIIAMTAHAMEGDRQRCLAAGMDGYVAKPVNIKELYLVLDQVLPRHGE